MDGVEVSVMGLSSTDVNVFPCTCPSCVRGIVSCVSKPMLPSSIRGRWKRITHIFSFVLKKSTGKYHRFSRWRHCWAELQGVVHNSHIHYYRWKKNPFYSPSTHQKYQTLNANPNDLHSVQTWQDTSTPRKWSRWQERIGFDTHETVPHTWGTGAWADIDICWRQTHDTHFHTIHQSNPPSFTLFQSSLNMPWHEVMVQ